MNDETLMQMPCSTHASSTISLYKRYTSILANPRNPRLRYTRAPRRGLIVASQFFSFFIKIIVASWDTAISGWPTEKRTDSDKDRSKESTKSLRSRSAANGQLDACFMFMRACVPRNYNSNRPNSLLFPANHSTSSHMTFERLIQQISKLVIQE